MIPINAEDLTSATVIRRAVATAGSVGTLMN